VLASLVSGALEDAAERRRALSLADLEKSALAQTPALNALEFLARSGQVKIIAEVKRASPSRGALAEIPDPAALAAQYELGGASTISVLTEGRKFGGSLADLEAVKKTVSLPVLRKDFIADPYQVFEARAAGADLVLLIAAALNQQQLLSLFDLVTDLGMTALVEAHSADEVSRAVETGAGLIGINARDLSTFELDQNLFGRLSSAIPEGILKVAESAVKTPADVAHYRADGADVVLIGEALVTGDPVATLTEFLGA